MAASELQKAVEKLVKREKGWSEFEKKPAAGPRAGGVSTGRPSSAASSSSDDLVEPDYSTREWWPDREVVSSDGLFTFIWRPAKTIRLQGNRAIRLDEPE